MSETLVPGFLFPAGFSQATGPVKLYLDESGTLGYAGEVFTMAIVLVRDLPRLETSIAKHKVTQAESKASQMRTAQKLALARTLIEENDIHVYLADLDPRAAMASERKLDKDMLYDSMAGQALVYYLSRGEMATGLPYRLSMDIRGSLRESYEDMVRGSIGNVLMHRPDPLVSDLDVRFLDSKFSAGVQAADLFSNLYRTALMQKDSPCQGFLRKYVDEGVISAGFTFGLPQLADQMTQIAADLRALVEFEGETTISLGAALFAPAQAPAKAQASTATAPVEETRAGEQGAEAAEAASGEGRSRSARRRRSRKARREGEGAAEQAPQNPASEALVAEVAVELAVASEGEGASDTAVEKASADAPAEALESDADVQAAGSNVTREGETEGTDAHEAADAQPAQADTPDERPARRRRGGKRHGTRGTHVGLSDAARVLIEQAASRRAEQLAEEGEGAGDADARVWHSLAEVDAAEEPPAPEKGAPKRTEAPEDEPAAAGEESGAPRRDVRPGRSLRAAARSAQERPATRRSSARRKAAAERAPEAAAEEEAPVQAEMPASSETAASMQVTDAEAAPAHDEAVAQEHALEAAPAEEPAPKKRARRSPRKKAQAEEDSPAKATEAVSKPAEGDDAPAAEKPAPKKRTRRSPRKPKAGEVTEGVGQEAVAPATAPEPGTATAEPPATQGRE